MSSREGLEQYGIDGEQRPKRDPSRETDGRDPFDDTDASTLADYGADTERTHVPDDELDGDASSEELHAAADEAANILGVSKALRLPFEVARHDLAEIDRREELSQAKSLAEKLRGQN